MIIENVPLKPVTESHIESPVKAIVTIYIEKRTEWKKSHSSGLAPAVLWSAEDLRDPISTAPQMHLHAFMKCFVLQHWRWYSNGVAGTVQLDFTRFVGNCLWCSPSFFILIHHLSPRKRSFPGVRKGWEGKVSRDCSLQSLMFLRVINYWLIMERISLYVGLVEWK